MKKHYLFVIIGLFCCYELFGQTHPTLRTARPGNTIGTFVVGKNVLQTQTGFNTREETYSLTERMTYQLTQGIRLGLSEFFELQFTTAYREINNTYVIGGPQNPKGIANTQWGFRVNISDGSKIPAMCIQYRIKTRWNSKEFQSETTGSRFVWAIGFKAHKDIAMNANLGMDRDGTELAPTGIYAIRARVISVPKTEFMVEYFGGVRMTGNLFDQRWTSNINFGVAYLLATDLKVDASVGGLLEEESDQVFWEIGLSWRAFLSKKEKELD